jgi:hypothetical protein
MAVYFRSFDREAVLTESINFMIPNCSKYGMVESAWIDAKPSREELFYKMGRCYSRAKDADSKPGNCRGHGETSANNSRNKPTKTGQTSDVVYPGHMPVKL